MITPPPSPLYLLVAASADRPGVEASLAEAEASAREGAEVVVLFTDDGLYVALSPWAERLARAGARTSLCGRLARARRLEPTSFPASVAWSSLTAFFRDLPDGAHLWSLFP
jgi:hypothetical protein